MDVKMRKPTRMPKRMTMFGEFHKIGSAAG